MYSKIATCHFSRSFYYAYIYEKVSWKTDRKESFKACWAISRPMSIFSPLIMFVFACLSCFGVNFFNPETLMDIQWRTLGERVYIGLFFMFLIGGTARMSTAGSWILKIGVKESECSFCGRQGEII
ncbi:hypothetical protein [Peribacillus sp. NPDC097295]|uniref:hypothetical protein n=1 Tax=Peribacillus sp. NPDC097295 TaxID=3364402 RepID=UPI00381868BB